MKPPTSVRTMGKLGRVSGGGGATISASARPRPRWRGAAVGTSGLVLSSYLAWQAYQKHHQSLGRPPLFTPTTSEPGGTSDGPDYISVPTQQTPSQTTSGFTDPIDAKAELMSMIPRHLRKLWKLLRQANWGDYEKHLLAVRELAALSPSLNDGECRQLAQSCRPHTAVGLARTQGVDLRVFLRPPPLPEPYSTRTTPQLFRDVLQALPQTGVHECIRFVTANALETFVAGADDDTIRDSDLDSEFQRDSHHLLAIPRRRYTEKVLIENCLQALLSHSTVRSHCLALVSGDRPCLALFSKIVQEHPDNPQIKSLIGKILANVSQHRETHRAVYDSGWVGRLAAWKQDPNLLVNLPAIKALCNLDQEFGGGEVYRPGIYLLLPEQRSVKHLNELSNWGVDVVFVHGLLGGVFYSWRQADPNNERGWGSTDLASTPDYSYCWPKDWLNDLSENVRVLGVDFDTYLSQWGNSCPTETFRSSLGERASDLRAKLRAAGVGKRPVVFVGHSMGGLIIKQMLVEAADGVADDDDAELVRNARGVVFYSTPHFGSHVAKLNATARFLFFPTAEVRDLEADSPALADLHGSFVQLVKRTKTEIVSFGELAPTPYLGVDVTFVPAESSDPGVGQHHFVQANHMNVCKPANRNSILFRKLYRMVWLTLDETTPFE